MRRRGAFPRVLGAGGHLQLTDELHQLRLVVAGIDQVNFERLLRGDS